MQAVFLDTPRRIFSPLGVSGCVLWLPAYVLGLNDGDVVGTWTDLSATGANFAQATATKKPTYKAAIVNGLPVVRFDGVDDCLTNSSSLIGTNTTHYTIIVVAAARSTSATVGNIFATGTSGVGYSVQFRRDTTQFSHYHKSPTGGDVLVGEAAGVSANVFNVLTADWDGSNTHFYRNGTTKGTTVVTDFSRASTTNSLGDDEVDGALQFGDWDIAEFVIYAPSLSAADRSTVERGLGRRYGVAVA